jgi:hypothetical protein
VITGKVINATTSAPITGARVTVQGTSPPGALTGQTDANGQHDQRRVLDRQLVRQGQRRRVRVGRPDNRDAAMLPVTGTVTVNFNLHR